MREFKNYKRTQIAEMRNVDEDDIIIFKRDRKLTVPNIGKDKGMITEISISESDLKSGSPKIGDKIARNPKNYSDQWLVAKDYFNDNFEDLD